MGNYEVNSIGISTILSNIDEGVLAIPEIQRPFVWKASQVRDLIDSLYKGYPIGYIIIWNNEDLGLKDGSISKNKKIIIDGQQRITSLSASLKGNKVFDKNYKFKNIKISFNPMSEKFEVLNPAISKSDEWIDDISTLFKEDFAEYSFINNYAKKVNTDADVINKKIKQLTNIVSKKVGIIELPAEQNIDKVTEVFNRINSKGVPLSQSDFAMSRIAANTELDGPNLRKSIDYFCHLIERPQDYENIKENDINFADSKFFQHLTWIKDQRSVFQPDYKDMLRIIFGYKFKRGRLRDFVSLLSGRNFETRKNEDRITKESFQILSEGILDFTNQHNFKTYLNRLSNIGMVRDYFIQSQNVLNFGYILFLILKEKGIDSKIRDRCVERWLILSNITKRYSGSSETAFQRDIELFTETDDVIALIDSIEQADLSPAFWDVSYIDTLSSSHTPTFYTFIMAQITEGNSGFLSTEKVFSIMNNVGDKHHIFPKAYLQTNGYTQTQYNQIANYVMMNKETNIKIGKRSPNEYLSDFSDDEKNYRENAIPEKLELMEAANYKEFLIERRKLISRKIKEYYEGFK